MAENKKLETLIRLQGVITEKLSLESERDMIPQSLKEDESALNKAAVILDGLEEDLRQAESEEKSLDIQYNDADHQSIEYQKMIESLSTMRELEAMNKQINEAEARAKSLLTARKAKNDQIKELKVKIESQRAVVDDLRSRVNEAKKVVESKLGEIETKINALNDECNSIKGNVISEDFYLRFYNIAKKKNGEGLVPVKGQVCMGCNTVLPMQFVIDLRLKQLKDEVDTCPYCSRMIYYDDNLTPEEEKSYIFDDVEIAKNITKNNESSDEGASYTEDLLVSDEADEEF